MRIMAIDLGDSRTGAAFSDITGVMAGEVLVLRHKTPRFLMDEICALAESREVSLIVVGNPVNMDGSVGERSLKSKRFAGELFERTGIETILRDERLTTVSAQKQLFASGQKGKKGRSRIDAVAAALILEAFLREVNMR